MTTGQADIDANPSGTTFCLSGTHNWTLNPKAGDTIIGGVLDGGGTTQYAVASNANTITLDGIEIRNYVPPSQLGAIHTDAGTGWTLRNLQVHDNGTVCATPQCTNAGGDGSDLGTNWQIIGGRYYNNRQSGLAYGGAGTVIDGVEIDHNDFTDDTYTTQNIDCGFEAGGVKSVANNLTVESSYIHDNACRGLWMDVGSSGAVLSNNRVANNWADGIMIEISSSATITGNTVTGNGFQEFGRGSPCSWGYGDGILISTSKGPVTVAGNAVSDNCSTIVGINQNRGTYGPLGNLTVQNNSVSASSGTGALNYFGALTDVAGSNLANNNIVLATNTLGAGIRNCGVGSYGSAC